MKREEQAMGKEESRKKGIGEGKRTNSSCVKLQRPPTAHADVDLLIQGWNTRQRECGRVLLLRAVSPECPRAFHTGSQ